MKKSLFATLFIALSGCANILEVTTINAPPEREKAAIPQEVLDDMEQDIRRLTGQVHHSRTQERVYSGNQLDLYRLEARQLSMQTDLRDTYTGEYYDCSTIAVRYQFNLYNSYYENAGRWVHSENTDSKYREDEVCTYQSSGRIRYTPGKEVDVSDQPKLRQADSKTIRD